MLSPANEGHNPGLHMAGKLDNYEVLFASDPLLLVDKHCNL